MQPPEPIPAPLREKTASIWQPDEEPYPFGQTRNTVFGGNPVPPSVEPFPAGAASLSSYAAYLLVIFVCVQVDFTLKSDPKQLFLGPRNGPQN